MALRLIRNDDRILLEGAQKHSPHFSNVPGARWVKKLQAFSYPATPITVVRLRKVFNDLALRIPAENVDKGVMDLWLIWQKYKEDVKWKTADAHEVAERLIANDQGYHTKTAPWPHQLCAAQFIENKPGAYLAMDMGTGKTLTMIEDMLRKHTTLNLIICPKSVCAVWADEIKKHAPHGSFNVLNLDSGTTTQRAAALGTFIGHAAKFKAQCVVIINYESFWRDSIFPTIKGTRWGMIIFDEAHRLKAAGSKCSKKASQLKALWKRGLSGTPLPNSPLDGYGQWRAIDPSLLGTSFAAHKARYAVIETYKGFPEIKEYKNQDKLGRLFDLQTFKVSRDILNLPDQITVYRPHNLTPKATRMYKEVWQDFCTWARNGEEVTAQNVLARLMKLRQISAGFVIDDNRDATEVHKERELLLEDVLTDIGQEEKIVVFCEFKHDFEVVSRVCKKLKRSYGEVKGGVNDTVNGKFPDGINVLAVQPKSGGLGLNLTKSCFNIFFTTGFSLSDHEQAKARTHRGGQDRHVTNIHLIAPGTVDEQIYQALKDKKEIVDLVMNEIL